MRRFFLIFACVFIGFTLSAPAAVFTSNMTISSSNTNFDGEDIEVIGCTVTIDGPHTFSDMFVVAKISCDAVSRVGNGHEGLSANLPNGNRTGGGGANAGNGGIGEGGAAGGLLFTRRKMNLQDRSRLMAETGFLREVSEVFLLQLIKQLHRLKELRFPDLKSASLFRPCR